MRFTVRRKVAAAASRYARTLCQSAVSSSSMSTQFCSPNSALRLADGVLEWRLADPPVAA